MLKLQTPLTGLRIDGLGRASRTGDSIGMRRSGHRIDFANSIS